jgi:hypothetical protein
MADSPLATALKPGMESDEYNAALQQIKDALDARSKKYFDPTLLAMAQGFLAPTATGSFGESLGQVAKNVGESQLQQQKEAMDVAQMRLQIAQAEREQARKNKGMEFLQNRGQVSPEEGAKPPQGGNASAPAMPTSKGMLTPTQIANIMYVDPELGKALETEYKLALESVSVQPGGVLNKLTGVYEPFGGKATVTRFIPADPATNRPAVSLDMTEQDAILLDRARTAGDYDAYTNIVNRNIYLPAPKAKKEEAVSGEPIVKPLPTPQSIASDQPLSAQDLKQQQDIETATKKAEAEALAKERAARTSAKISAASDAESRRQASQIIQELFKGEGMDQVTGVLEKPGFLPAVLKMAEEGVNLGRGYSISVPQIRDIFTANKINLSKIQGETRQQYDARVNNVIDKLQQASSLFAQITFGMRSLAKGSGSISNFEQEIFNRMGPTTKDSLATILAKSKHMEERANFDQAVANGLVNSNMPFDKYSQTPEYKTMVKDYDTKIKSIYAGVPLGSTAQPAPVKTTPKPSGNVNPEAAKRLRDLLNTSPR